MAKRLYTEKYGETSLAYPSPEMQELFKAILALKTPEEASNFFRDLLTMPELREFTNRWQMVKMLVAGKPYTEIATKLKTSTTTVTRVAHWLSDGMGGYKTVATRLYPKPNKQTGKSFKLRGKYTLLKNPYSM
jgi:TrpR-related protein YerC/YecD